MVCHVHDLTVLLFFSGLNDEIERHPEVWQSLSDIRTNWTEKLRYEEPSSFSASDCAKMHEWLSDPAKGVVPWLEARL